jgi:hypothetical protein
VQQYENNVSKYHNEGGGKPERVAQECDDFLLEPEICEHS